MARCSASLSRARAPGSKGCGPKGLRAGPRVRGGRGTGSDLYRFRERSGPLAADRPAGGGSDLHRHGGGERATSLQRSGWGAIYIAAGGWERSTSLYAGWRAIYIAARERGGERSIHRPRAAADRRGRGQTKERSTALHGGSLSLAPPSSNGPGPQRGAGAAPARAGPGPRAREKIAVVFWPPAPSQG